MLDGRLDVAFVQSPDPVRGALSYRHLRTEPLLLAVAADAPLARFDVVPVAELDGMPLALYAEKDDPDWQRSVLATLAAGGARVEVVARGDSAFDNLPLVASGRTVTPVSASLAALVAHTGVAHRPLAGEVPTIDLGVVRRAPAGPALEALLDVLTEAASGEEGFALL